MCPYMISSVHGSLYCKHSFGYTPCSILAAIPVLQMKQRNLNTKIKSRACAPGASEL